ncbi:hypothetical protein SAMN05428974_0865 [Sphingopyxis sp. YR583]|jgi:undecaprenyl pyrophosphate phosphatase UppP|uniref:hypothetical protein n=1 Tax=Sphingopyxis sp. YR583 TaxID=1881047 RepID=UPI0008A7EF5F|nr:hypothetical protein [Sphingopyxis sp. YR583]SEH13632.1 hypothetical protein SAMN05428974_0865 [Sphingopyxis sp. YR583]
MLTPLWPQRLLALPFLILGGWCLFAPHMVERLSIAPDYRHLSTTSALLIGCFGAQAVLGGLFIAFSRWTRGTFAIYAAALLPFFWFNYYFVFVVPVMTRWMALDLVSNLVMLGLCLWGYRVAPRTLVPAGN